MLTSTFPKLPTQRSTTLKKHVLRSSWEKEGTSLGILHNDTVLALFIGLSLLLTHVADSMGDIPLSCAAPGCPEPAVSPGEKQGRWMAMLVGRRGTETASGGGFPEERLRLGFPGISAKGPGSVVARSWSSTKAQRGV